MRNRQIELVRALRNNALKQAIDNYCSGVSLARIIPKECLNADAINEFRKLHVLPFHTAKRKRCRIVANGDKSCGDIAPQKKIVKYPQLFEDYKQLNGAQPANVTIPCKGFYVNWNSAANACAEA